MRHNQNMKERTFESKADSSCCLVHLVNQSGIAFCYECIPQENLKHTILPSGCMELVFVFNKMENRVVLVGPTKKVSTIVDDPLNTRLFGVVFMPAIVPYPWNDDILFGETFHQCYKLGHPMAEQIFATQDFFERIQLILSYYQKHLPKLNPFVKELLGAIGEQKGNVLLNDLYDNFGYSRQYANYIFKTNVGVSPNSFCKVFRFQNIIYHFIKGFDNQHFNTLVKACGYYDQPHMNKEFKEFTDSSPEVFLHENQKYLNNIQFI